MEWGELSAEEQAAAGELCYMQETWGFMPISIDLWDPLPTTTTEATSTDAPAVATDAPETTTPPTEPETTANVTTTSPADATAAAPADETSNSSASNTLQRSAWVGTGMVMISTFVLAVLK